MLYNRTIDRGAHPNQKGPTQSAPVFGDRLDLAYLPGDNKASRLCLNSTAQSGVVRLHDTRGHAIPDQFTTADADLFDAGLNLGPRVPGRRLGILKAFFRFAVNRKSDQRSPGQFRHQTAGWVQ